MMNNIIYFICISVVIAILTSWLIDLIVDKAVRRIRQENREFETIVKEYIKYELTDKDYNIAKDTMKHALNERLNNE